MKEGLTFIFYKLDGHQKTAVFKRFGMRRIPSIRVGSWLCVCLNASYGDVLFFHGSLHKRRPISGYSADDFLKVVQ